MPPSVFVLVISVTGVLTLGAVLTATAPAWRVLPVDGGRLRLRSAMDSRSPHRWRTVTAIGVALAGFALTLVVSYLVGRLAHALEPSVDVPIFDWFKSRQLPGSWTDAWNVLTKMGNRAQTQRITVIMAVLLAALWRRRGWWVPLTALPVGYLFEKFGQQLLAHVVHRGHPPTTMGTFPSGGCARVMVVYGLVIFLILRWKGVSRQGWVAGWTLLTLLAVIEAYSRTYLLKHWFTDAVGGVLFGSMVLCFMIGAVFILDEVRSSVSASTVETALRPESALTRGRREDHAG